MLQRSPSRLRSLLIAVSRKIDAHLPNDSPSSLVVWAVFTLLAGLLALCIVRDIWDGALTGCPGYDGVTHQREAEALCVSP